MTFRPRPRTFLRQSACRDCGAPLTWAKNARGKWLPLEREAFPPSEVPHRERLLIRGGIATNVPDAREPVAVDPPKPVVVDPLF